MVVGLRVRLRGIGCAVRDRCERDGVLRVLGNREDKSSEMIGALD